MKNTTLVCPNCGHIITGEDLKDLKCTDCGKSFKVNLVPGKEYKFNPDPTDFNETEYQK